MLVSYSNLELNKIQDLVNKKCNNIKLEIPFNGAISYLGTYLHKRGFTFSYIASFENDKEQLRNWCKNKIRCIAISTTFIEDVGVISNIVHTIREYGYKGLIIVGGAFMARTFSEYSDEAQRQIILRKINADFYINSYFGEESLVKLLFCIKHDLPVTSVSNLYYRNKERYEHSFIENDRKLLKDNIVDWSLYGNDLGIYVPVRTAISCMYRCEFCSFPVNGGKYQSLDVALIQQELDALHTGNVKILNFIDDAFNLPDRRFKGILETMINRKYGFQWHSFFRVRDTNDEILQLMKNSGCKGILMGIESGSPYMLEKMNKKIDLSVVKKIIDKCKRIGILTYTMFIVGFPGETIETVQQTIDFINEAKPDFYAISPWSYNISAPIHEKRMQYNLKGRNYTWQHNTMCSEEINGIIMDIYFKIKNSVMLTINYTFLFQLIYHQVNMNLILEINNENIQQIISNNIKNGKKGD